jgi:8-oxo-dGTP pyrophosphatase MutT (NUDIX family)
VFDAVGFFMPKHPLFRPQDVPVIGVDTKLPARAQSLLSPLALRDRFASPPVWVPEWTADPRFNDQKPALAAVLVPIVARASASVLFTLRAEHLDAHPGQISFPGGRHESGDRDLIATALRETHEEVGLAAHEFEVLGVMPEYTTGTGFVVTPVVALLQPDYVPQPDPDEVAEVFEVPLEFLMNPANHRHHAIDWMGQRRHFLSMPWQGEGAYANPREYFIWGATAAMLRNLYQFLGS